MVPESERIAFHTKIDLLSYVADYEKAKKNLENHDAEPELLGKKGRPYLFHSSLYPNLISRLEETIDIVGFGPTLVATMVGIILKSLLRTDNDVSIFEPSQEWCRWFLRTKMGLVKRRVTSHAYSTQEREKQSHLHQLNLDHLAKMIAEDGLTSDFIFCTDELGVNLQPEEVERWVKKGAKVVSSSLSLDKRSFTANIIANATGEVIAHHQIFGGKTEACLPADSVRESFQKEGFIFSFSDNHWNNQRLKLVELTSIHSWKVQKYIK